MPSEKARRTKITSFLLIAYGVYMVYVSVLLMDLFSSGWFEDAFNLVLAKIMLPISILCIVAGAGLIFLRRWGRIGAFIVCPFYLAIYAASVSYSLLNDKGFSMDIRSALLFLAPIMFIIYYTLPGVKKQYK